jgi:hypothetical protein
MAVIPIPSHINPLHALQTYLRSVLIEFSHQRFGLPSCLLHSGFPTKAVYESLFSPIRSTCATYPIPIDVITPITSGEDYKSWSPSLCSFLHSLDSTSLWGPNISLGPCSRVSSSYVLPLVTAISYEYISHVGEMKD